MSEYEIENGVAIPPIGTNGRGRPATYPWEDMDDGDSFFVPCRNGNAERRRRTLYQTGYKWCRRHRPAFTVNARIDGEGVRVWMIRR